MNNMQITFVLDWRILLKMLMKLMVIKKVFRRYLLKLLRFDISDSAGEKGKSGENIQGLRIKFTYTSLKDCISRNII